MILKEVNVAADSDPMNCTRCGAPESVVRRDAAYYCGRCAVARDWSDVIAIVQEGPRGGRSVSFDEDSPLPAETDPVTSTDPVPSVTFAASTAADPFAS